MCERSEIFMCIRINFYAWVSMRAEKLTNEDLLCEFSAKKIYVRAEGGKIY